MDNFQQKKKFISFTFLTYLGVFFGFVSLYLNDHLRAELDEVEKNGKKKEKLKEIHDRNASSYEKKSDFAEVSNSYNRYRRILLSHAKGRVLELGVGTGRSLEYYKPDVKELVGIDYSNNMLKQAIEKSQNRENFRIKQIEIKLMEMDAESLDFPDNSFDCVVDFMNMQCYSNYKLVISNIKRVLKDGGNLIVVAKGQSDYMLINQFYQIYRPYFLIKKGYENNIKWDEVFEKDEDLEIVFKSRKNLGRNYLYIFKLHKKNLML